MAIKRNAYCHLCGWCLCCMANKNKNYILFVRKHLTQKYYRFSSIAIDHFFYFRYLYCFIMFLLLAFRYISPDRFMIEAEDKVLIMDRDSDMIKVESKCILKNVFYLNRVLNYRFVIIANVDNFSQNNVVSVMLGITKNRLAVV